MLKVGEGCVGGVGGGGGNNEMSKPTFWGK